MGLVDSLGQVFAVLSAVLGGIAIALYKAWKGARRREQDALSAKDEWIRLIEAERNARDKARVAEDEAKTQETEAVARAREGRRDHFEQQ